jgi:hypothetical protein
LTQSASEVKDRENVFSFQIFIVSQYLIAGHTRTKQL